MEIIDSIKEEINYNLNNIKIDKIKEIRDLILKKKNNNIYFSGIGKCETIAIHLTNLLKSISYKSFYLNIQNSSHGDIGTLDENSLIMLFSKSGNTKELIDFIKIAKIKKIEIISITCTENCTMKNISNYHYALPLKSELNYGIINVPTNSCVLMLIFSNILVKLLDNITLEEYKTNHLGGSIGNDLKIIGDLVTSNYAEFIYHEDLKIMDIVLEMTNKKMGIAVINDNENKIIGIITDGDIRRLLINNENIKNLKKEYINNDFFKFDNKNIIFKDIKNLLLKHKFIPLVNEKFECIGILYENLIKNNI